jgi:hypothetical protein
MNNIYIRVKDNSSSNQIISRELDRTPISIANNKTNTTHSKCSNNFLTLPSNNQKNDVTPGGTKLIDLKISRDSRSVTIRTNKDNVLGEPTYSANRIFSMSHKNHDVFQGSCATLPVDILIKPGFYAIFAAGASGVGKSHTRRSSCLGTLMVKSGLSVWSWMVFSMKDEN